MEVSTPWYSFWLNEKGRDQMSRTVGHWKLPHDKFIIIIIIAIRQLIVADHVYL